jgi:hypothetical protein
MGDLPLLGTNAQIIRIVEALFGVQPGNTYYTNFQGFVAETSLDALSNALVGALAPADAASLAATVAANYQVDPALETADGSNVIALLETYITAQLNTVPEAEWGAKILEITNQYTNLWTDPLLGASVTKFNDSVVKSLVYSANPANSDVNDPNSGTATGDTINLTLALDNLTGTDANDIFNAFIFNNSNTLQSGDKVDGGAGMDTLFADIGNSQNFAITPDTNSVEKLQVRAQAVSTDSNENNMSNGVQIDAERMHGTTWYESNNSRADVTIEDVRILRKDAYGDDSDQITQDITVAMVSTDPGLVDLGVYFDQHSLTPEGVRESNSITLTVANQLEVANGFDDTAPLKDIPYTNVGFLVNDQQVVLALDLTGVSTYDDMWTVMETAFNDEKAINDLLSDVTITRIIDGDSFFSRDGDQRNADQYNLVKAEGQIAPSNPGWTAEGGLPPSNAFSATVLQGEAQTSSSLITANILLDDVGRGSMGGDLIVGGLSTGITSDSKGVEQFDIIVERNSELQEIQSTNNTLEVVNIVNGTNKGNLVVAGDTNADGDLPGSDANTSGFLDVRVLDASAMVGTVDIDAELSSAVVTKYMNLKDNATDASIDNVGFMYDLGTNNDTLSLNISADNLAAAGSTTREDFFLDISGNGGDDTITTKIGDGTGIDGTNWYVNSRINANLTVNGDSGNDTIKTVGAGDFNINAGSGNDTVYANNDGIDTGITSTPALIEVTTQGVDAISDTITITYTDNAASGGVMDTGDTIDINIDGLGVTSVPFNTDFATTLADVVTAYQTYAGVQSVNLSGNTITIVSTPGANITATSTFTDAGVAASAVSSAVTDDGLAAAAVSEIFTATFTAANAGDTIIFDGVTTLFNVATSANDVATAVAANAGANWAAVAAGDKVTYTATTPGAVTDVTAADFTGSYTGVSVPFTAETATWVVNTADASIASTEITNLQSDVANNDTILYKATMTVTYSGAGLNGASGVIAGNSVAYTNGFESKVTIGTTDYVGNEANVNQAIKAAINNNDVSNKLLVAKDGPANTLVIESLVDGEFNADDLTFNITGLTAAEFDALSTSEKTGIQNAFEQLEADSSAVYTNAMPDTDAEALEDLIIGVGDNAGTSEAVLATNGGAVINGAASSSVSDNVINLGNGNDVAVLGTDATSNDTLVFEGSFGDDAIFNFDEAPGTSQDRLDFTAYLGGLETLPAASTSVNSQTTIPTVAVAAAVTGAGANAVDANEVQIVNDFVQDIAASATETWANLTAADLLAAIKADTNVAGAKDYGNITVNDFTVNDGNADLVGTTIKNVFMIENDLNAGEYKVFEVTATGSATDEFTDVTLVGTIDFGAELTAGNLALI